MHFARHLIIAWFCLWATFGRSEAPTTADYAHHNLHNFIVTSATFEHAAAMGYRYVTTHDEFEVPDDPAYRNIGLIRLHNAAVSPIRIQERKSDGKLFVSYHFFAGTTPEGLNPVALSHGLRRINTGYGEPYPMEAADLELLKGLGAARLDLGDLDFATATYADLLDHFHTAWPLENETYRSANVRCNWQSRRVVADMVASTLGNIDWTAYSALFFDTLLGGVNKATNANYGGDGTYADGLEGKMAFVQAVADFVRDPAKTGTDRPYQVFTNVYDPIMRSPIKRWFASGQLRLDHHYFEKGSKEPGSVRLRRGTILGQQYANGVVPGTTQPAYVNRDRDGNLVDKHAYLPAHLVSLDDTHSWSRHRRHEPDFDHAAFFAQHLDACGTAGIQGSWFGWYGEDCITHTDTLGRPIYPPALQLLRALPNWDNLHRIPVPPYRDYHENDARSWDGQVYRSSLSFASKDIIYSRHPDTGEVFVVFLKPDAYLSLRPGESLAAACLSNALFSRTTEDALTFLRQESDGTTVTLTNPSLVGRGFRLTLKTP